MKNKSIENLQNYFKQIGHTLVYTEKGNGENLAKAYLERKKYVSAFGDDFVIIKE